MNGTTVIQEPEIGAGLSAAKRALLERRMRQSLNDIPAADSIRPRTPGTVIPISAEQRRIWLHSETNSDLPLYNESITIHRRGSFSLPALEQTLTEIVRRHEAWRTSIDIVQQELVQIVAPQLIIRLPLIDLTHLPVAEREQECLRLATEDATCPIALDTVPLFRAQVVRMADDDHRLHLTLHHVIFDGVSIYRVLMPELAALYTAFASGQPSPLAEPTLQYGDYTLWRREHVASAAVKRSLEYWKTNLAGPLPVLALPTDRPRPAQISHRGSMEKFQISAQLLRGLRALSRQQNVTLYMTLLAAFKVMIFRYTGQQDVIIGGATDARRRPELEGLIGYFLDTFAVRSKLAPECKFSDYLHDVRDAVIGALSATDVPFDAVVQAVQPRRDSSHHPIFQVFFSIEPPVAPFEEGWDLTQMDVTVAASKFDLYLELDERPDHMAARIMYSTDLFDAPTIQRMAQHWLVLLEAIVVIPDCTLGTLPMLTSKELSDFAAWNATERALPQATAYELIRAQARCTPNALAASHDGNLWSYVTLLERTEQLATRLSAAGVLPGALVAICLNRSLDMLAGLLAVWHIGAAYLPLDPEAPPARIELCLDDVNPAAILSEASLLGRLPHRGNIVLVDADQAVPPGATTAPQANASPEDLAYVIHTSGTTGRPKAVEINHVSLVNLLLSMQARPGFATDTLLAVTTVSFDIAALELFLPLISGGTVCMASRETALDPYLLAEAIDRSGCTVMQATPSTWSALLESGWKGSRRPLKILCGGEALPAQLAQHLLAAGADLWNVYGPTETTVWSAVHHVQRTSVPIPIGTPIANTTTYILDSQQQLVPLGVPGKLFLGGTGLARGYRGQPQLTEERFIHAPMIASGRIYDTGDLAVRRANGVIECLGRTDNQMKIRGFRVELEAIEAAVRRHPQIAAAAARCWQTVSGTRLCAYIVANDGNAPSALALREFLKTDQPDYMLPADVVVLEALPLTQNGKLDRAQLPEPVRPAAQEAIAPPRTRIEQTLADLWSQVLGVESIERFDNFFHLGGHSLLVATLQQRVQAAFGHRLSLASLFHAPTLQAQAALIQAAENSAETGLVPLQTRGTQPTLFWLHPPPLLGQLTNALGKDQPLLGVALTSAHVAQLEGNPSIHAIAAHHVRTILACQPQGPFYLGGLCTGGIVAYETAVQLREAGHDVAQLILLDAQNPVFFRKIGSFTQELAKLRFYIRQALRDRGSNTRATLMERLGYRIRQVWPPSVVKNEVVVGEHLTDSAALQYRPPVYAGPVLLLQPVDRPASVNHQKGWQTVVSDTMTTMDVQGHHDELLDPKNVKAVAKAIATHLTA